MSPPRAIVRWPRAILSASAEYACDHPQNVAVYKQYPPFCVKVMSADFDDIRKDTQKDDPPVEDTPECALNVAPDKPEMSTGK